LPGDASSIIDGVPLVDRRASARRAELKEIDRAGCLELLASGQIGRVVYTEAAMPAAHPVNYLLDGEEVVFRAGEGAKLAAASRGFVVGFQATRSMSSGGAAGASSASGRPTRSSIRRGCRSSPTGFPRRGCPIAPDTASAFPCSG
jgi:hypothetical protein